MVSLREGLLEVGAPLTDEQFNAYIKTSPSLAPCYHPVLTTLETTTSKPDSTATLSFDTLIWHLQQTANCVMINKSINKSNSAIMAVHLKYTTKNSSRGPNLAGNGQGDHCQDPKTTKSYFVLGSDSDPEWETLHPYILTLPFLMTQSTSFSINLLSRLHPNYYCAFQITIFGPISNY